MVKNLLFMVSLIFPVKLISPALPMDQSTKDTLFKDEQIKINQLAAYIGTQWDEHNEKDPKNQKKLYEALTKIRKGEVKGIDSKAPETLILLMAYFPLIRTLEDNLDKRAMFNLANCKVNYADQDPNQSMKAILYQDAFYLYTCLMDAFPEQAYKNSQCLLKLQKIQNVISNPKNQRQLISGAKHVTRALEECLDQSINTNFDYMLEDYQRRTSLLTSHLLSFLPSNTHGEVLDEISKINESTHLQIEQEVNKEKYKCRERVIEKYFPHPPSEREHLALEQAMISGKVPDLNLTDEILKKLLSAWGNVLKMAHETPLIGARKPVIIPIGRSVHLFAALHNKIGDLFHSQVPVRHILASGLSEYEPTLEQRFHYQNYLNTIGFDKFTDQDELLLVDVCETGSTLQQVQRIIEELYPQVKGHTQFLVLLYDKLTMDLAKARAIHLSADLMDSLFAKHNEKSFYCAYPTFYPQDWVNWSTHLAQFKVPEGARKFDVQIDEWIRKGGHTDVINDFNKFLSSYFPSYA